MAPRRFLSGLAALAACALALSPRAAAPAAKASPRPDITRATQAAVVKAVRSVQRAIVAIMPDPRGGRPFCGLAMDGEGHIVTVSHSLRPGASVTIATPDGRQAAGKVLALDSRFRLAVIKTDARGLTPARLRKSRSVPPGAWLVAVGRSPGGGETATAGVLSARDREVWLPPEGLLDFLLQTDAAVNSANEGGALADLQGRTVGIGIDLGQAGRVQGISFAIPSEIVARVCPDLIRHGRFRGAWFGIRYRDLKPAEKRRAGGGGIVVENVLPATPAARAGAMPGDIILRLNGEPIANRTGFQWKMIMAHPGDTAAIEALRGRRRVACKAVLGTMPREAR